MATCWIGHCTPSVLVVAGATICVLGTACGPGERREDATPDAGAADAGIADAATDVAETGVPDAATDSPDGGPACTPTFTVTTELSATDETLILDGETMPSGWSQASDPSLHRTADGWEMFFTSVQLESGKLLILRATPDGGDLDANHWTVDSASPVISPGSGPTDWDRDAVETAKYVEGYDNTAHASVQRIYYTGEVRGAEPFYAIGCVQWSGDAFVKCAANPVLVGTHSWELLFGRSLVGDETVHYEPGSGPDGAGGTWHMWYNANSDLPEARISIGHATSSDGLSWPEANRSPRGNPGPYPSVCGTVLTTGPYYSDMTIVNGAYSFVGWIPGDRTTQGIYMTQSCTLDGSGPGDFGQWSLLVAEANGSTWHDYADVGPCAHAGVPGLYSATLVPDGSRLWLFYLGERKEAGSTWDYASIGRVLLAGP